MSEEDNKAPKIQCYIKWAQFLAIIPLFLVMLHFFHSIQEQEIKTVSEFFSVFIKAAQTIELASLAYISTTLIVSTIYSIIIVTG